MPSVFDSPPLSSQALALRDNILSVPVTYEPIHDDLPGGMTDCQMEELYHKACAGNLRVVPELRKLIARYPSYPTLLNFLRAVYLVADKPRQAAKVLEELAQRHPDYLFTRLGLAEKAFWGEDLEQVREALGPTLDLSALDPSRKQFHISEVRNYYMNVGRYYALANEIDAAKGVSAALELLEPGSEAAVEVLKEIAQVRALEMRERFRRDDANSIRVKIPPLPKRPTHAAVPDFEHSEVHDLYLEGLEIPLARLREILGLPRESLVRDLIRVLDDAILRTPDFMKSDFPEEETCGSFHALHLLAELGATEALEAVLRFYELHPDALDYWLGDLDLCPQLARIVQGNLQRCSGWLKSPGIDARGKIAIADGMTRLALVEPAEKNEVCSCLEELFRFVLASPPADNLLDTHFLSLLMGNFIDLRAMSSLPLLTEAWDRGCLEETMAGSLADITREISAPLSKMPSSHSLAARYGRSSRPDWPASSHTQAGWPGHPWGAPFEEIVDPPTQHADLGRNDPCPCGSRKKYKKCCMRC